MPLRRKKKTINKKTSKKMKDKISDNSSCISPKGDDVGDKKNKKRSSFIAFKVFSIQFLGILTEK